jgi:hypothetical protein
VTVLVFPPADADPWPTLGPQVCEWIENWLVHGPGDLFGEPVRLNDEIRAWIYRMYEIEPALLVEKRGRGTSRSKNPLAGRRRFERCILSLRKGSSKTELAAWIGAAELHAEAPVRCTGFVTRRGVPAEPDGAGVTDPYIPMMSSTEEQTEELAYGALRRILDASPLRRDFDIGLNRILRVSGDGKAEAVAATPNARDGARTTFQHLDESHRIVLDAQKRAWSVMLANMGKRPKADPWALETTTAPEPGGGSVAESTMDYVLKLAAQKDPARSKIFFYHREASQRHDLATKAGLRAAILEASGPFIAEWTDVDRIMRRFEDGDADRAYAERVWLNRRVQSTAKAFDAAAWRALVRPGYTPANGTAISLGFDGGRFDDATGIVATELATGHQWVIGVWERPDVVASKETPDAAPWEVSGPEVDGAVDDAFARWTVTRMYCDPPKWESYVAAWAGRYGETRVAEWWTNRRRPMAYAIRSFANAIRTGEISHDGDAALARHIGNSCRASTNLVDDQDQPLWVLRKERPDSPHKIDLAMAATLSWEARNDSIAAGEGAAPNYSVHFL